MKILYFFEPQIELGRPYLRFHNLRYQMGPQIRGLMKNNKNVDVKIIIGDGTFEKCKEENYDFEGADFLVIKTEEIREISKNYLDFSKKIFFKDPEVSDKYALFLFEKLEGWVPDVVISFLSPLPDFKKYWPNTSIIYTEFGIFSRSPYPRTFYFDTQGMFSNSSIRKLSSEVLEDPVPPEKLKLLHDFRKKVVYPFFSEHQFSDENFRLKLSKFKANLLLPLQFSSYFGFDAAVPYADQFEFLIDVLDNVSPEIGIVVTEHTGWMPVINNNNKDYLYKKYPNLIFSEELNSIRASSQYLMNIVDGVITVSSSVGLHSIFWDKPVFSPWNSQFRDLSEVNDLSEITLEKISSYKTGKYDEIVFHLLTRFYLNEKHAYDGCFFEKFIKSIVSNSKERKFIDRYPLIISEEEVFETLTDSFRVDLGHKQYVEDLGGLVNKNANPNEIPSDFKTHVLKSEVISFDIFDTLIDRPFASPHELFLYIQPEVRKIVGDSSLEFHKLRRYAEHIARNNSLRNEVNIEEIYDCFFDISGIDKNFKQKLIDFEFSSEFRFCKIRKSGWHLFNYAISMGKKVVLISDFYFGAEYIKKLLAANDYLQYDDLYVSVDFYESKKEGSLFEVVLNDLNKKDNENKLFNSRKFDASKILHVGDNLESDVENAKRYGYTTFHTPKASSRMLNQEFAKNTLLPLASRKVFPSDKHQLGQSIYIGLFAKKYFDFRANKGVRSLSDGNPLRLGYVILGPLLFSFTQWLIKEIKNNSIEEIYFLSRDGKLLKKAYDIFEKRNIVQLKSEYLYSSRRSYSLPAIFNVQDAQEVIAIPFNPCELNKIILSRFEVDLDEISDIKNILGSCGIESVYSFVHPVNDLIKLKKLISLIFNEINEISSRERSALNKYIKNNNFFEKNRSMVVDIGYAGTIQNCLSKILDNKNIFGRYVMTHAKAELLEEDGFDIRGFLKENVEHNLKKDFLSNNISLFELLFSSSEQSLEKFNVKNNKVELKFKNTQNDLKRIELVHSIQTGALNFVDDILDVLGDEVDAIKFSKDFIINNFENLFLRPHYEDALIFSGISAEDGFSGMPKRFLISENSTNLNAADFLKISEWKHGANSIIKSNSLKNAINAASKNVNNGFVKAKTEKSDNGFFKIKDRPLKLYKKFKRDPYLYFADSSIPFLRIFKNIFK